MRSNNIFGELAYLVNNNTIHTVRAQQRGRNSFN